MAAGVVAIAAAAIGWAPALAQSGQRAEAKTPDGWSYRIENGRRVPKGKRVDNPDGSWTEEIRDGECVTLKQMSASGEYRETRKCD